MNTVENETTDRKKSAQKSSEGKEYSWKRIPDIEIDTSVSITGEKCQEKSNQSEQNSARAADMDVKTVSAVDIGSIVIKILR